MKGTILSSLETGVFPAAAALVLVKDQFFYFLKTVLLFNLVTIHEVSLEVAKSRPIGFRHLNSLQCRAEGQAVLPPLETTDSVCQVLSVPRLAMHVG